MAAAAVSPELALVDPTVRQLAVEQLPRLEPFDFLRFGAPRRHPDLDRFAFLARFDELETARLARRRRHVPLGRDAVERVLLVATVVSAAVTVFATIQAFG